MRFAFWSPVWSNSSEYNKMNLMNALELWMWYKQNETKPCVYITRLVECHDDVIKWKHFPRYWPAVRGICRSLVNSTHKCQWRGALIFSLIFAWNKQLSKQSWGWWFATPLRCHCNVIWWYSVAAGDVTQADIDLMLRMHNDYRRNVTPSAANMMKMVNEW